MKHTKKILALLLALLMTVGVLMACANGNKPNTPVTNAPSTGGTDTVPGSETETEADPTDLPDIKFDGQTITSISGGGWQFILEDSEEPFDAANYRAAANVAEKYGVVLVSRIEEPTTMATRLAESVMSGDFEYDFTLPHPLYGVTEIIIQNCLVDYNTLTYVDFEKPWWNKKAVEGLAIRDKIYYACSDINLVGSSNCCLELVNKKLLTDVGYDKDLYQLTFDGLWTCDELLRITEMGASDLDGDQVMSPETDQFGYLNCSGMSMSRMLSMGQRATNRTSDGFLAVAVNDPHMVDVADKYYQMAFHANTYVADYSYSTVAGSVYYKIMQEGRAVVMDFELGLRNLMRALDYEYLILPLPKYDEKQDEYVEWVGAGMIGVCAVDRPLTCVDVFLEALAYECYQIVRPVYYDNILDQKVARDEESQQMLDMIFRCITFDAGYNYDPNGTVSNILYNIVINRKNQGTASYLTKISGKLSTFVEEMNETLYNR